MKKHTNHLTYLLLPQLFLPLASGCAAGASEDDIQQTSQSGIAADLLASAAVKVGDTAEAELDLALGLELETDTDAHLIENHDPSDIESRGIDILLSVSGDGLGLLDETTADLRIDLGDQELLGGDQLGLDFGELDLDELDLMPDGDIVGLDLSVMVDVAGIDIGILDLDPGSASACDDCRDGDSCSLDLCVENVGACVHTDVVGCCEVASDCATGSLCELAACVAGRCIVDVLPLCGNIELSAAAEVGLGVDCTSDADCDDGSLLTVDVCLGEVGLCAFIDTAEILDTGVTVAIGDGDDGVLGIDISVGDGDGGLPDTDVTVGGGGGGVGVTITVGDEGAGAGSGSGGATGGGGSAGSGGSGSSGGSGGSGTGSGSGAGSGDSDDDSDDDDQNGTGGSSTDSDDDDDDNSSGPGLTRGSDGDSGDDDARDEMLYRGGACSVGAPGSTGNWGWLLAFAALALFVVGRRRARAVRVGTALAVTFGAGAAGAQEFSIDQNAVPHAPEDLLWTERPTIPMDHLSVFMRAMIGYAKDPLVVRNTTTGDEESVIGDQMSFYLNAGLALLDRFHLALMVPFYAQSGGPAGSTLGGAALGNIVLDARVNLLEEDAPVQLGAGAGIGLPGPAGSLAADDTASGGPRLSLGKSFGKEKRTFVALNTGIRLRGEDQLENVEVGSEFTFGLGAAVAVWGPLAITGELSGRTTLSAAFESASTPVGLLFGIRYAPEAWSIAGGAGPGISGGYGTPDVRALAAGGVRLDTGREKAPEPAPEKKEVAKAEPAPEPAPAPVAAVLVPIAAPAPAPVDTDGDGILDPDDKCPNDRETVNNLDDTDGCPDLVRVAEGQIQTLEPVFFSTGSATIEPRSYPMLEEMAAVIEARPELGRVSIEGHTDSRGSDKHNLQLSEQRARSVRMKLESLGVAPTRLESHGFGETKPIDPTATDSAHALNRRVEFRFSMNTTGGQN